MFSATDFLPACITEFMNFVTTTFPNFGSGRISRLSALWRRDICLSLARVYLWLQLFTFVRPGCCRPPLPSQRKTTLLGSLCSVFRTPLLAVFHALRIEHATQDVIAHAREILDAPAADHHHRMLLQVMALAGDVADNLEAVGQAHLGDLAQCRVRLLRRRRIDARADTAFLRALLQGRHLLLRVLRYPRLANELIDRRHLASTLHSGL